MEIKTTEEISIEDYTKVANKKWVAVDDLLEKLEDAKITIRNTLMGDAEDCYVDVIDDLIKSLKEMM